MASLLEGTEPSDKAVMIAWLRRWRPALFAFIVAGAVMDVWFVHVVGMRTAALSVLGLLLTVVVALLVFVIMSRVASSPKSRAVPRHTPNRRREQ